MTHQHFWIPDALHLGWETCLECKSARNTVEFPREKYLENYWDGVQHSTIEQQRYNLEVIENEKGETKVQAVLKHCKSGPILEVACAPGSFLKHARLAGFEAEGIEPDDRYTQGICDYSDCDVTTGFFEDIYWEGEDEGYPQFWTIVAMDLLEHLSNPERFVERCRDLLFEGGRLILMIPTIDTCREQDFHPEHVNLWSQKYIQEWLKPSIIEEFLPGHTVVVVEK